MTTRSKIPRPPEKRRVRSKPAKVTLADVARRARVSPATASRVLNAPERVKEDPRARVLRAIEELNFIPHGAAKALASHRTRTIGALIPRLGHQLIAEVLEAVQDSIVAAGYTLILGKPNPAPDEIVRQAAKMIEHGVEALVLMGEAQPPALIELLERRRVFYVTAWTSGHFGQKNCIGIDNYAAMEAMIDYLLGLGHRTFALIARRPIPRDSIMQRVDSATGALATRGIAIRPQHKALTEGWGIAAGREAMRAILATTPRPTAVVCTNDYQATGAVIEARAAGLDVPGDISITGFDDIEIAEQMIPALTTVRVPGREIGDAVGDFIVRSLQGGSAALPARFPSPIVERGTTARVRLRSPRQKSRP